MCNNNEELSKKVWEQEIAKEITKWNTEHWIEKNDCLRAKQMNTDTSGGIDYFFRAMTEREAGYWLGGNGYDIIEKGGHQGFSPNINYSQKYFGKSEKKYPIILVFESSGYIQAANSIGIQNGALENGVFAYGIGWKSKNSIKDTDATNKKRAEEWKKNSIKTGAIQRIMKAVDINEENLKEDCNKRKILNAIMFIESIQSVSIAMITKQCYQNYEKMKIERQ